MGEAGFILLLALVVGIPWYVSTRGKQKVRERMAPVNPKSTKVVLGSQPTPTVQPTDRASALAALVINTGASTGRGITKDGASQHGIHGHHDPHAQFGHGHAHDLGVGHGHGDGHC